MLFGVHIAREAILDKQSHEPVNVSMFLEQRPIEPARFVVLAIGVVVTGLRTTSSPIPIIGTPKESIVNVKKFLICRFRNASTPGSSEGPSTPQFQLRLSSVPSRLPSPFASLCFWL